jgi:hypothetical protein
MGKSLNIDAIGIRPSTAAIGRPVIRSRKLVAEICSTPIAVSNQTDPHGSRDAAETVKV